MYDQPMISDIQLLLCTADRLRQRETGLVVIVNLDAIADIFRRAQAGANPPCAPSSGEANGAAIHQQIVNVNINVIGAWHDVAIAGDKLIKSQRVDAVHKLGIIAFRAVCR